MHSALTPQRKEKRKRPTNVSVDGAPALRHPTFNLQCNILSRQASEIHS